MFENYCDCNGECGEGSCTCHKFEIAAPVSIEDGEVASPVMMEERLPAKHEHHDFWEARKAFFRKRHANGSPESLK